MAVELQSVTFTSPHPESQATFWGDVLARSPEPDGEGILLAGEGGQVGLRFASGPPHGPRLNRMQLHLSESGRGQSDTIAACLQHGGHLKGSGRVPPGSYAVMADVADDEFCVIADDNSYLAGCGPLGEVTCDGSRAVGIFWSEVLGWPLVWEEGEETAIQSPAGGTKIAWSGDSVDPLEPDDRQYFVLTASTAELDDEIARLVGLGATVASTEPGTIWLTDPDGNRFVVRAS